MPTKIEKDDVSGQETTGHVWDGIKELNNPLPKWWLYVLWATVIWSIAYYFWSSPIPGVQGFQEPARERLEDAMAAARQEQSVYLEKISATQLEDIIKDPDLLNFAIAGGGSAFANNCAPCHGQGGAGGPGFPTLADDAWIWGGTLEDIHQTLLHGIRSDDPETRYSEMVAFGDGLLDRAQISDVAEYVLSLTGKATDSEAVARGKVIFEDNCVACHAEGGVGDPTQGAPALNDAVWLYGGTKADIEAQVTKPKHGVMPAWGGRLDDTTLKMLTVYVHSLGGGQ
jgi:cytochrome c oxidase cbb3-type subunit III